MKRLTQNILVCLILCLVPRAFAEEPAAPFSYVWGKAYHVLAQTHNNESGYFSLCEGLDGKVYVGTAKYGVNSYLVEFDPIAETQRIVIDTHRVCGLSATGFAAQAKIHTRNFTGPSGKIYVGSKQGYRQEGDTSEYPGGYLMTYDPRTGAAENSGMPYPGQGIIDAIADEARGLLYVVTCEEQHWMVGDIATKTYRELGPILVPYATTLIDGQGRANAITKDFQIAQYDPATSNLTVRDIVVDGSTFTKPDGPGYAIPCWALAADGKTAYMNMISFSDLIEIDLSSPGDKVRAVNHGKMIDGAHPDSRNALCIAADGKVYALIRVDNATGFGGGYLHHLVRFDPATKSMDDLGVLAVRNPDFFDFGPGADGKTPPWSHGYHTLPDGTLTPLHGHQALTIAQDGTLYATILYPFTLLRIDAAKPEAKVVPVDQPTGAARRYLSFMLESCDMIETALTNVTRVAEIAADRHLRGGMIGFPFNYQGLQGELWGRSGGLVHIGFGRPFKKDRTEDEKRNDMAIIGWARTPFANEMTRLEPLKERGAYIIGFGPAGMPELQAYREVCDAWFDTGFGADDRVVDMPDGSRAGRGNLMVNTLYGWTFMAEFVSALTRRGNMPTMWKAYSYEDGPAWGDKYLGKKQFHDDYHVAPIAPGDLGRTFLERIRYHVRKLERGELANVAKAADMIAAEHAQGRQTIIASMGHMAWTYVAKYEGQKWGRNADIHSNIRAQVDGYKKGTPDGALVLRLGYSGTDSVERDVFREKKQRVMYVTSETRRDGERSSFLGSTVLNVPADALLYVDMGYAFGDACVSIDGYPIPILPPSGIMQLATYECINVETLARLAVGPSDTASRE